MTKDELKRQLELLDLPERVMKLLGQVIETASEVNQKLLDLVAEVLELQADVYDQMADLAEIAQDKLLPLEKEMDEAEAEYRTKRWQAVLSVQEEMARRMEAVVKQAGLLG